MPKVKKKAITGGMRIPNERRPIRVRRLRHKRRGVPSG